MKVSYIKNSNTTTLKKLERGAVFRPVNSKILLIKLGRNAQSSIFTNKANTIWQNSVIDYGGEDFTNQTEFEKLHEYSEFILCADVVSGIAYFIYEGVNIIPLKCELLAEE